MDRNSGCFNDKERYLNLLEVKPISPAQKNKVK